MVSSHRFAVEIACPVCSKASKIKVVEDGGPPFTDVPRRTYVVEAGVFQLTPGDPPNVDCIACGASFLGHF